MSEVPDVVMNGDREHRYPGNARRTLTLLETSDSLVLVAGAEYCTVVKHGAGAAVWCRTCCAFHLVGVLLFSTPFIFVGCINLSFAYVEGESLLMALKDVALSSGR